MRREPVRGGHVSAAASFAILRRWPTMHRVGLRKWRAQAYRFPGTCSRLGPPNRGREQSLNPVNYYLQPFQLFSLRSFLIPTCKDDANRKKVSSNFDLYCFLDDR